MNAPANIARMDAVTVVAKHLAATNALVVTISATTEGSPGNGALSLYPERTSVVNRNLLFKTACLLLGSSL